MRRSHDPAGAMSIRVRPGRPAAHRGQRAQARKVAGRTGVRRELAGKVQGVDRRAAGTVEALRPEADRFIVVLCRDVYRDTARGAGARGRAQPRPACSALAKRRPGNRPATAWQPRSPPEHQAGGPDTPRTCQAQARCKPYKPTHGERPCAASAPAWRQPAASTGYRDRRLARRHDRKRTAALAARSRPI